MPRPALKQVRPAPRPRRPWTPLLATAGVLLALAACRAEPASPLEEHFRLVRALAVTPIEPFARAPASVVVLPDGRMLFPESDGSWIHVVGADGQGLTRLGGPAPAGSAQPAPVGRYRSLSGLALLPDGRLLAIDRGSPAVTVYGPGLETAGSLIVPRARQLFEVEPLTDGRLAAAVAPRNPVTGGQVVLFAPGDSGTAFLRPNPLFEHNRWSAASSPRIHVTGDGRILVYWAALPWAYAISPAGDSLPTIGQLSALYQGPPSGPRPGAPLEAVRRWYDSFTPLVAVESAGPWLVFEYRAASHDPVGARRRAPSAARQAAGPATSPEPGQMFLNLYDASGKLFASDLLLPPASRLMRSNDAGRLYLLKNASPRELRIEVWEPRRGS